MGPVPGLQLTTFAPPTRRATKTKFLASRCGGRATAVMIKAEVGQGHLQVKRSAVRGFTNYKEYVSAF